MNKEFILKVEEIDLLLSTEGRAKFWEEVISFAEDKLLSAYRGHGILAEGRKEYRRELLQRVSHAVHETPQVS